MSRPAADPLLEYCEGTLGSCVVSTAPGPTARRVLRLVDRCGDAWFAKQAPDRAQWVAELRAYRRWVPTFADQSAVLRAADESLLAIVTSAVPGRPARGWSPETQRHAGSLLRRIHHSRPARETDAQAGPRMVARLESLLRGREGLFAPQELRFIREQVSGLADLPGSGQGPVHGDYLPRNWIVGEHDGQVRVIDFARSRRHVPAFDLTRLGYGAWWDRPDLMQAFLDGYGRALEPDEMTFLGRSLAATAMNRIRRGAELGRPGMVQRARQRLVALMNGEHPGALTG
ncbi:aminoglycoside phosphotransferase family protein [Nocardioides sp.]|uniref:phosphotransferase n=1 Tax=Nocardioides sp. TaxID=35761 RepID=UPI0027366ED0|nr:aminoglycoside phosphotransferase family protein [Nocardioides sp.]MDP3892842.1 aminoglycoside phosphotransferase family protein [Nocardioides sp.]